MAFAFTASRLTALRHMGGALLVVASLAAFLHTLAAQSAGLHYHTAQTFLYLGDGWQAYLERWNEPWVSRIGSTALGFWTTNASTAEEFCVRIGWWVALWFVAVAVLWLWTLRDWRHQLLAVLVNCAAIAFAYLPTQLGGEWTRIYPWDMPALFFMTLALLLIERRAHLAITGAVVLVGMLMKETVGIVFLLPLLRRQVRPSVVLLLCAVAGKLVAKAITGWQPSVVELVGYCSPDEPNAVRFLYNLRYCFRWEHALHPIFTNAGWLLAAPLFMSRKAWPLLALLALFWISNLACGVVHEYRIWFEAVPIALLMTIREESASPELSA